MHMICELSGIQFDEESLESWIMAMPFNKYHHPEYGTIDITQDMVAEMVKNVNDGVRGQELDIDYDHKEKTNEAAGWVKQAEARDSGLWLLVSWTKKAYDLIKSRAYKYFSPEFTDSWKHPVTGVTYNNVLFGGGITNRPFLKGISPLNLSELSMEGGAMTPEQFAELLALLKLEEGATVEDVFAAIKALAKPADENQKPEEASEVTPQLSEKSADEDPKVRALSEMLDAQAKELHELRVKNIVAKLCEGRDDIALSNTAANAITGLLNTNPSRQFSEQVSAMLDAVLGKDGLVRLNEIGSTNDKIELSESDKLQKRIDELVNGGMKYSEAAEKAIGEMPEAFDAYAKGE